MIAINKSACERPTVGHILYTIRRHTDTYRPLQRRIVAEYITLFRCGSSNKSITKSNDQYLAFREKTDLVRPALR